jgi:hypothetical protein
MAVTVNERIIGSGNNKEEVYRLMLENFAANMRVSIPGIIQSFDPVAQTVVVQPAIQERVTNPDLTQNWATLPLLLDVPIVLPRAGGFAITMPITAGDECLVIFSDMCIDAWFSNSGVQNQIERRRHDLSDAFAIIGIWSQPNVLSSYSTTSMQMRNVSGSSYISIANDGTVTVKGKTTTQTW